MSETRAVPTGKTHCFVGYVTAGYPNREESLRILEQCCRSGLDVLELGFPARDAALDGEVIRKAQMQADKKIDSDITYWRQVRAAVDIPIWLMGYRQDLLEQDAWLALAKENLYDALVIPDTNREERSFLREQLRPFNVSVVGFVNSEQSKTDLDMTLREADIIYHQLYCGQTGVAHNDDSYLSLMKYVRANSNAKLFAGFGINTVERVLELLRHGYDGTIIGSAIMKLLETDEAQAYRFITDVHEAVRSMK